jgi:hypothetical protein
MRSLRTVTDRGCGYAMNMFLLLHSTITEKQSKISPVSPHTDSGGFSAGLNPQTRVAYRAFDTQTLGFLSRSLPSLSRVEETKYFKHTPMEWKDYPRSWYCVKLDPSRKIQ